VTKFEAARLAPPPALAGDPVEAPAAPSSAARVVTGLRMRALRLRIWSCLWREALRRYGRPRRAIEALRALARLRRATAGGQAPRKYAVMAGRTFFSLHAPGFPSRAFERYAALELNRVLPFRPGSGLQTAILAITNRCELACAHCSEWDTLRRKDPLALEDLRQIVAALRESGAPQIQVSGGEPLLRLPAVEVICADVGDDCDVWVLTSGSPLDAEAARRLRVAGATGVMVSLDHHDAAAHDAFRGSPGAFERAVAGVRHAAREGLAVALSLTTTRGFVSETNLERYAVLARQLGVGFIQVLEPRAAGRWAGADVSLTASQVSLLEAFDRSMNVERLDMPLVDYPGLGQRRDGCWGAGNRYLFIDAAGGVHACPFCRGAVGNVRTEPLDALRARLQAAGCHAYQSPGLALGR